VRHFHGTYSELLEAQQAAHRAATERPPAAEKPDLKQPKKIRQAPKQDKRRFSSLKTEQLEAKIIELEKQVTQIDGQLADPEVFREADRVRKLLAERDKVADVLAPIEKEWLYRADRESS